MDHVSHGKSDGRRGVIPSHSVLTNDFVAFYEHVVRTVAESESVPIFLFAHSMGTLVALTALRSMPRVKAICFSGTPLFSGPGSSSPFGMCV